MEVGILISQVVDTVELTVDMDKSADTPLGFLGSAIMDGQITMFVDMEEILRMSGKKQHQLETKGSADLCGDKTVRNIQDRWATFSAWMS